MSGQRRTRLALLSLAVIAAVAAVGPQIWPIDPDQQLDPASARLRPPGTRLTQVTLEGAPAPLLADRVTREGDELIIERRGERRRVPADAVRDAHRIRVFWLGSDALGRDVCSRLLSGARVSLVVALLAGALALCLGTALGAAAAMSPRLVDGLIMRTIETGLAFPPLALLALLGAFFRPSLPLLVLLIGATSWMGTARLVRGRLRELLQQDFVRAARALGATPLGLLRRHLLPNAATPLLVDTTFKVANVVLLEAALSFLGWGVQPPLASWGNMIAAGREHLRDAWWISAAPGLAIVATVFALAALAEALRGAHRS